MERLYLITSRRVYTIYNPIIEYGNIKNTNCACGLPFDADYAIAISVKNLDNYIREANERLQFITQTHCMNCRVNMSLKKNYSKNGAPGQTGRVHIMPEQDGQNNSEHTICKDCVFPIKAEITYQMRQNKINSSTKSLPVKCAICLKTHQVELKYLKQVLKSEDGNCCVVL